MYVKLDDRNRITLPKDAAALFENGLVDLRREDEKVVLEPVNRPFSKLRGMIKDKRSIRQLREELERDLESGKLVL